MKGGKETAIPSKRCHEKVSSDVMWTQAILLLINCTGDKRVLYACRVRDKGLTIPKKLQLRKLITNLQPITPSRTSNLVIPLCWFVHKLLEHPVHVQLMSRPMNTSHESKKKKSEDWGGKKMILPLKSWGFISDLLSFSLCRRALAVNDPCRRGRHANVLIKSLGNLALTA